MLCGDFHCPACAPPHAAVQGPVCPACVGSLLTAPSSPPRRVPWGRVLGLLALGLALAAFGLRPPPAETTSSRAWRTLERTGEALEAFAAREGRYPDLLVELVPRELPAVPQDPWDTSSPLRYAAPAANPDGRILYSVGPDRLDQRGVPRDPVTGAGDLVYPVR